MPARERLQPHGADLGIDPSPDDRGVSLVAEWPYGAFNCRQPLGKKLAERLFRGLRVGAVTEALQDGG